MTRKKILYSTFLFLFSFILRAFVAHHGQPFCYHNDEHWIFSPAFAMVKNHTWDPGWYIYPPFLTILYRVAITIFTWIHPIDTTLPDQGWLNPEFILPYQFPLLYLGRLIISAFGAGTVVLIYAILRRLTEQTYAFLFAILYSILFVNISYSSFLRPEPLIIFFLTLSMYFLCRFAADFQRKWVWFAGMALGFACGSKYNACFFLLTTFVFFFFFHKEKKEAIHSSIRTLMGACVGFILSSPLTLWKSHAIVDAVSRNYRIYKRGQIGDMGTHRENFIFYLEKMHGYYGLSFVFILGIIAVISLPYLWNRLSKEIKPFYIASVFFPLSYVWFLCQFNYRAERNLIIIYPFIFLSAGIFLFHLYSTQKKIGKYVALSIIIATTFNFTYCTFQQIKLYNQSLPQDHAMQWFNQNVQPGIRVLKEFETPVISPARYAVAYIYAGGLIEPQSFAKMDPDYLILSRWVDNAMKGLHDEYVTQFYDWIWSKTPDFEDANPNGIPFGIHIRIYDFRKYKKEYAIKFKKYLVGPDQSNTN